jgi:hypothetical protein
MNHYFTTALKYQKSTTVTIRRTIPLDCLRRREQEAGNTCSSLAGAIDSPTHDSKCSKTPFVHMLTTFEH